VRARGPLCAVRVVQKQPTHPYVTDALVQHAEHYQRTRVRDAEAVAERRPVADVG